MRLHTALLISINGGLLLTMSGVASAAVEFQAQYRVVNEDNRANAWAFQGSPAFLYPRVEREDHSSPLRLELSFGSKRKQLYLATYDWKANGQDSAVSPDPNSDLLFPVIDEVADRGTIDSSTDNSYFRGTSSISSQYEVVEAGWRWDKRLGHASGTFALGLRQLDFSDTLITHFESQNLSPNQTLDQIRQLSFKGVGPLAKIDALFPLTAKGLGLHTTASVAYLDGDRKGSIRSVFHKDAGADPSADVSQTTLLSNTGPAVTNLELSLGLRWSTKHWDATLSYWYERWDNLVNTRTRNTRLDIFQVGSQEDLLELSGTQLSLRFKY
jgi:hypothetical protein